MTEKEFAELSCLRLQNMVNRWQYGAGLEDTYEYLLHKERIEAFVRKYEQLDEAEEKRAVESPEMREMAKSAEEFFDYTEGMFK